MSAAAGKLVIALDILEGIINVQAKIAKLLQPAVSEGRDLTDDELKLIRDESQQLEKIWLDGEIT